jgi:hypothetical protein
MRFVHRDSRPEAEVSTNLIPLRGLRDLRAMISPFSHVSRTEPRMFTQAEPPLQLTRVSYIRPRPPLENLRLRGEMAFPRGEMGKEALELYTEVKSVCLKV